MYKGDDDNDDINTSNESVDQKIIYFIIMFTKIKCFGPLTALIILFEFFFFMEMSVIPLGTASYKLIYQGVYPCVPSTLVC